MTRPRDSGPLLVLASASPARARLLLAAGVAPLVRVSAVDEAAELDRLPVEIRDDPPRHCLALAQAKARDVASAWIRAHPDDDALVVGCDSVLDVGGVARGKPGTAQEAARRWREELAGRSALLLTGHWVVRTATGQQAGDVAATRVDFVAPEPAEIDAYVATGEPLGVAGAFTLDGLGGVFVERIDGDPSTVVGLSLPLLRRLVGRLGVAWTSLWTTDVEGAPGDGTASPGR